MVSEDAASRVALLMPAAGHGTRLGGRRKQLRTLGDAPVLVQTLRAFAGQVSTAVVATPPDAPDSLERALENTPTARLPQLQFAQGGDSRQASVAAALHAVPDKIEVVLVHDAVRPFIAKDRIQAVIAATHRYGAAALALPVADTLRCVEGDAFGETVARDGLYRMQTPQGFRKGWLLEAHAQGSGAQLATDDVELVQRQGRSVRCLQGDTRNFKITTPEDWAFARQLWPVWS